MAWPSVLSAQPPGADQVNKAVTLQLVQQMHYYIECCLLQGLTLDETAVALQHLGVQERLTRITWKQLELQNPRFFSNYLKELALKVLISPKQASAVDKHFAFSASNPYAGVETKIMVLALDLRTQASMTCRYST